MRVLLIAGFGTSGVLLRYFLDQFLKRPADAFPWTIFGINIVGSFLAGAIYVFAEERGLLSPLWKEALLIGFCGGLTTFSAFSLDAALLWQRTEMVKALIYLVSSPVAGFLAVIAALAAFRNSH